MDDPDFFATNDEQGSLVKMILILIVVNVPPRDKRSPNNSDAKAIFNQACSITGISLKKKDKKIFLEWTKKLLRLAPVRIGVSRKKKFVAICCKYLTDAEWVENYLSNFARFFKDLTPGEWKSIKEFLVKTTKFPERQIEVWIAARFGLRQKVNKFSLRLPWQISKARPAVPFSGWGL